MNLAELLLLKFPTIDLIKNVVVQNDGQGDYIKKWDFTLGPLPTTEDLSRWENELTPIKELETIRELRKQAYPAIGDQLDALYKAMENGILPKVDGFYDQIKLVKESFPKPE